MSKAPQGQLLTSKHLSPYKPHQGSAVFQSIGKEEGSAAGSPAGSGPYCAHGLDAESSRNATAV